MHRSKRRTYTYRLFFDVPAGLSEETPIRSAIAKVAGASELEVSLPYRTARFRAAEPDCQRARTVIEEAGILVIGLYQSP